MQKYNSQIISWNSLRICTWSRMVKVLVLAEWSKLLATFENYHLGHENLQRNLQFFGRIQWFLYRCQRPWFLAFMSGSTAVLHSPLCKSTGCCLNHTSFFTQRTVFIFKYCWYESMNNVISKANLNKNLTKSNFDFACYISH